MFRANKTVVATHRSPVMSQLRSATTVVARLPSPVHIGGGGAPFCLFLSTAGLVPLAGRGTGGRAEQSVTSVPWNRGGRTFVTRNSRQLRAMVGLVVEPRKRWWGSSVALVSADAVEVFSAPGDAHVEAQP
jgi:hypothetical protein